MTAAQGTSYVPKGIEDLVPDGRYALHKDGNDQYLHFFEVRRGAAGSRWAGYCFVDELPTDGTRVVSFDREARRAIKNPDERRTVLEALGKCPEAWSALYGLRTATCGICHRPLSDPESVKRGIGPDCATEKGWL